VAFCPKCRKKLEVDELRRNLCDSCGMGLASIVKPAIGRGTLQPGGYGDGPLVYPEALAGTDSGRVIGSGTAVPPENPPGGSSHFGTPGSSSGHSAVDVEPVSQSAGGTNVGADSNAGMGTAVEPLPPDASEGGGTVVIGLPGADEGMSVASESGTVIGPRLPADDSDSVIDIGMGTVAPEEGGSGTMLVPHENRSIGKEAGTVADVRSVTDAPLPARPAFLSAANIPDDNLRTAVIQAAATPPAPSSPAPSSPDRLEENDRTVGVRELLEDGNIERTINLADLPPDEAEEFVRSMTDEGAATAFDLAPQQADNGATFMDTAVGGGQNIGATIMDAGLSGDSPRIEATIMDTPASRSAELPASGSARPSFSGSASQRIVAPGAGAESNLVIQPRVFSGDDVPPLANGVRADYELQKQLGKGGMGIVTLARQTSVDRNVAIKFLKEELASDPSQRESFLTEAVVTAELDHPNIVPIYDLGRNHRDSVFYAMKCVTGTPWHKVVRTRPLAENLDILMKCCDAVAFAHSRGVVHRDLKPENIMLGEFGEVLVMDWGLAIATKKFAKSDIITQTTSLGGSPAYMSPELATSPIDRIGDHSDVYLMGAILYEIVTGSPPHTGRSVSECLKNARENIIKPTTITGELVQIALKAMSTRIQDRHPDIKAFQAAIREYQSHNESRDLAVTAYADNVRARETSDYRDFARAVFGYEAALNLWEGNTEARQNLLVARREYAEAALAKGDFDLGLTLLDAAESNHSEPIRRLKAAKREREQKSANMRRLKYSLAALISFALVGAGVALYVIDQARKDADRQRVIAVNEEKKAQEQKAIAIANEQEAKKQEAIAKEQTKIAIVKTQEAIKQQEIAEKERMIADTQRKEAVKQKGIAEEQTQVAIEQKQEAIKQEQEAIKQKQIALENALLAEWEEFQADRQRLIAEMARAQEVVQRNRAEQERNRALYEGYVSQVGLASTKIEESAFDAARELLDQLSAPEFAMFRGWEFDRLRFLCDQARSTVALTTQISAQAISPKGDLWAVGGRDGKIRLLTLPGLASAGELDHGHALTGLAFSPDGKRLASTGLNTSVLLWNVADRQQVATLTGHQDHVLSVRFSTTGSELLTTSFDTTARVWNLNSGKTRQILRGHSWYVRDAAWSRDGRTIVTAGEDQRVLVFQRPNLDSKFVRDETRDFNLHKGAATAVALSDDASTVCSGDSTGVVWLWRPADQGASDQPAATTLKLTRDGHNRAVTSLRFDTANGERLLSASDDNTLKLWDLAPQTAATGTERTLGPSLTLRGHGNVVKSALFGPSAGNNGSTVFSVGFDGKAMRWETSAYAEVKVLAASVNSSKALNRSTDGAGEKRLEQHGDEVLAVAFDGSGKRAVTASRDQSAVVWDLERGQPIQKLVEGHAFGAVNAVALRNRNLLITAALDQTVRFWSMDQGSELQRLDKSGTSPVLATSADGKWLLTGSDSGDVRLWDIAEVVAQAKGAAVPVATLDLNGEATVVSVAFSPDARRIAVGNTQGEVEIWSFENDATVRTKVVPHGLDDDQITGVAFGPDGRDLFSAGLAGTVVRWNLADGSQMGRPFEHNRPVRALALARDGKSFVTLRETANEQDALPQLVLWSVDSPNKPVREFGVRSEHGVIRSAVLSDDGRSLLSTAVDGPSTCQMWSLADGTPTASAAFSELQAARAEFATFVARDDANEAAPAIATLRGGEARIWNLAQKSMEKSFAPHQAVPAVDISDDGAYVATGSLDGSIKVWDANTGRSLLKIDAAHARGVLGVAFAPGVSDRLLSCGDDKSARLWTLDLKAATHKPGTVFEGHTGSVNRAIFSANGKTILTGSDDRTTKLWSVETGNALRTMSGQPGPVRACDLSSDGTLIVTADESSVLLWDARTGERLLSQPIQGHGGDLTDVRFAPDRLVPSQKPGETSRLRRVLTASLDGTAKLWDLAAQAADTDAQPGDAKEPTASRRVDGSVRLVSRQNVADENAQAAADQPAATIKYVGKELLTLVAPEVPGKTSDRPGVTSVLMDPTGRLVITGDRSGRATLWLSQPASE
jgi:WD40 repeat protein/serine/threonine protein kinase